MISLRIFDHPKSLIGIENDITGYFSKWIKMIYKRNMLLNELIIDIVRVVWILSVFLSIYSNSKKAQKSDS